MTINYDNKVTPTLHKSYQSTAVQFLTSHIKCSFLGHQIMVMVILG